MEFHPILVADVLGFVDVLTGFWDKKAKSQGYSGEWPEKPDEYNIFVNIWVNITKIRSRVYLGLGHIN